MGANMAVRREAFVALDGFETALGPGSRFRSGGDWEIGYRALHRGFLVVQDPGSSIVHWGSRQYDKGEVRSLVCNNYYGIGAGYGMHIRRADWSAAVVGFYELAATAWNVLSNVLGWRRPFGFRRQWFLIIGLAQGICFAGEEGLRQSRLRTSDRTEERAPTGSDSDDDEPGCRTEARGSEVRANRTKTRA
jgi:hypothetical protein